MTGATWTVQRTGDDRFPVRIAIGRAGRVLLAVRARAPRPGAAIQVSRGTRWCGPGATRTAPLF
ncbi:MAG: hypothetical protein U0S76_09785 [Pseudoxanthomonas sp.]|nr:hypothetical protein [Pseudoxanthomonas sp.]